MRMRIPVRLRQVLDTPEQRREWKEFQIALAESMRKLVEEVGPALAAQKIIGQAVHRIHCALQENPEDPDLNVVFDVLQELHKKLQRVDRASEGDLKPLGPEENQ